MFEKKVLNIYSIIIGLFFLVSGIGKVADTTAFGTLIYQYGFGDLMILAPLIAVAEVLLGLNLILLINPKKIALFSFILLGVFTISFAYAHFKHGINDCGCLGTLQQANISPVFSFTRNFILLLMSLLVLLKYPQEEKGLTNWKKYIIITFMSLAIFISGVTFKISFFNTNAEEEHHPYQNQNIKNTELSKYLKTSKDSTYLIFCFSYTCPHCLNSIQNLRHFKSANTVDSVIALASGETKDKILFEQSFHPDFYIQDLAHDKISVFIKAFPTAFYIKNDTIKVIIEGELPSSVIFKSQFLSK